MTSMIFIVGMGDVGAGVAQRLLQRGHPSLTLMDGDGARAGSRALDLAAAAAVAGLDARVTGTEDWADAAGAATVVIAEGDAATVGEAARQVAEHAPGATVVVAAEPVDALTHLVTFTTKFPRGRVVGVGGVIASARFRALIAAELGMAARDIWALVVGEHGETMVPLSSSAAVAGVPLRERVAPERMAELERRVRDRRPGDDVHARSAAAAEVVHAIAGDSGRVLSCCALCEGELGLERVCLSVPVRLGHGGVREIVELPLSDGERAALDRSAAVVRERVSALLGSG